MIPLDQTLYFHNMKFGLHSDYWKSVREESGSGGRFYIDLSERLPPSRFVSRHGEWSLPWKQELIPGYEMPVYDPTFSKSFEQVTDERAIGCKQHLQNGKKIALMYSGGIDSTVVLISFLKNFNKEELENVHICASILSVVENPSLWNDHVVGKMTVLDSNKWKYDDLILAGYVPVTADEGDCIFGTSIGLQLYNNYEAYLTDLSPAVREKLLAIRYELANPEVHYSRYRDVIVKYFALNNTPSGLEFGRILYEKYNRNVQTSNVPINSLHDFFWWLIFDVKYLNCSVRSALFYSGGKLPYRESLDSTENWFNGADYQRWSMVNNNNGQKIKKTLATYKWAARKYIYDFYPNEWYYYFKPKLESLNNLVILRPRPPVGDPTYLMGVTKEYQPMLYEDQSVLDFFRHHMTNYNIDWTETNY